MGSGGVRINFNMDAIIIIIDPTFKSFDEGPLINKRPKANALDNTLDMDVKCFDKA